MTPEDVDAATRASTEEVLLLAREWDRAKVHTELDLLERALLKVNDDSGGPMQKCAVCEQWLHTKECVMPAIIVKHQQELR